MSKGPSTAKRFAPPRLTLGRRAVSPEAKALVVHCLERIVLPSLIGQQKRPSSITAITAATEGLLGGLLALTGEQWARRPMSHGSFTAEPGISSGQFRKALAALEGAELIERSGGGYDRSGPVARGIETRLRLTETGRQLAASFGAEAGHFAD